MTTFKSSCVIIIFVSTQLYHVPFEICIGYVSFVDFIAITSGYSPSLMGLHPKRLTINWLPSSSLISLRSPFDPSVQKNHRIKVTLWHNLSQVLELLCNYFLLLIISFGVWALFFFFFWGVRVSPLQRKKKLDTNCSVSFFE